MARHKAYSYIRFSTPDQLQGDSLRRQLDASLAWCARNDYDLDTSLRDLGVSAYRGRNRTHGALANFLDLIQRKVVKPGCALVVECLDRLSREEVEEAFTVFLSIIRAGVDIVTLGDGEQLYKRGNLKLEHLLVSLVVMSRAHEDSRMRAMRVGEAWAQRRRKIQAGEKLGGRCPSWLVWNGRRNAWDLIPKKVKVIRRVFDCFLEGNTLMGIAVALNRDGVPSLRGHERARANRIRQKRDGWDNHTVKAVLVNRNVLGEYQPRGPDRKPDGPPVPNYYPPIIEPKVFHRAAAMMAVNKGGGGRSSRRNPFGVLVRCGYCGGGVARSVSGDGRSRLRCTDANRGLTQCGFHGLDFGHFENAMLLALADRITAADLSSAGRETRGIPDDLDSRLQELDGDLAQTELRINHLTDTIADEADKGVRQILAARLQKEQTRRVAVESEMAALKEHKDAGALSTELGEANIGAIRDIIKRLKRTTSSDKLAALRQHLHAELTRIIERITVYMKERYVCVKFRAGGHIAMFPLEKRFFLKDLAVQPVFRGGFLAFDLLGGNVILERYDPVTNYELLADSELAREVLIRLDAMPVQPDKDVLDSLFQEAELPEAGTTKTGNGKCGRNSRKP